MIVYRIAKSKTRTTDLSGMGAYKQGGRWNNPGTYMLYTSQNSSLAYLENLVHFDADNVPPNLFIMSIELKATAGLIYTLPDDMYPKNWMQIGNPANKNLGDELMTAKQYLAIIVRSAINAQEYNYLLNPLFPGYHDIVKVKSINELDVDVRLIR